MVESKMFNGRIDNNKKKLIIEFENQHPKSLATIGYGSGVIEQIGNSSNDKKQIDIIDVVEDLGEWITENMIEHPEEFTKLTLNFFKKASLKQLERGAPIVYFSANEFKGELIKRGVISKKQFLSSCYDRTSSYVPFRLEKVVELIKCDDEEIYQAMVYDHKIALMSALLMLSKEERNLYDLMIKICSLSYLGDFRMKIHCEDPNKIKNIVDKQYQYFIEDYEKVNFGYFDTLEDGSININYSRIEEDVSLLPIDIYQIVKKYGICNDYDELLNKDLERYFKIAGEKENLSQAIKGVKTVGFEKALSYGVRKIKKGFNRKK